MALGGFAAWRRSCGVMALALLAVSAPAVAGSSALGSITGVLPHSSGGLFFAQTGTRSAAPSCATVIQRWVINVTTAEGQAMAAALLTAYMAHKRITVQGTGDCGVWADTETVNYFIIED